MRTYNSTILQTVSIMYYVHQYYGIGYKVGLHNRISGYGTISQEWSRGITVFTKPWLNRQCFNSGLRIMWRMQPTPKRSACYNNNSNVGWIFRICRSNLHGILLLQQNHLTFDDLTHIIQVVNVTETLLASDFTCQELSRSYYNAGVLGWQAYFGTYFVCDFTLAKSTSKAPPTMGVGDSLNVLTMS